MADCVTGPVTGLLTGLVTENRQSEMGDNPETALEIKCWQSWPCCNQQSTSVIITRVEEGNLLLKASILAEGHSEYRF